jgi:hypothetical protein
LVANRKDTLKGTRKDLNGTTLKGAEQAATEAFGHGGWLDVQYAFLKVLSDESRLEERAALKAYAHAATALSKARGRVATTRRRFEETREKITKASQEFDLWFWADQLPWEAHSFEALGLTVDQVISQIQQACTQMMDELVRLAPAPTKRSKLKTLDPKRSAWEAAARRAGVKGGEPADWALAGIALGLDAPCPHDTVGDQAWESLEERWRKTLDRARTSRGTSAA